MEAKDLPMRTPGNVAFLLDFRCLQALRKNGRNFAGTALFRANCWNIKETIFKSPHQHLMHIDEGMQETT